MPTNVEYVKDHEVWSGIVAIYEGPGVRSGKPARTIEVGHMATDPATFVVEIAGRDALGIQRWAASSDASVIRDSLTQYIRALRGGS